ncbi:MAG TPA: hypothetical protein VGL81_07915 [Polyangiaceae bacterium]
MKRGRAYLPPVLVVLGAMVAGEACGQAAAPAASGGSCQLTSDCQEGYVCITQPDGSRQCSNDLTSIQLTEEAGAEAAATPMDAAAPMGDGSAPPPQEGGVTSQDSGSPPPPQDSGSPPKDSGSPPQDTGSPPQDTGSPPQDTGSPPQDTGSPPQEAGGD